MTTTLKLPSLKALAENKIEGVTKMTGFRVHPSKIVFEEGFNLREEGPELDAHIERLFQAMKQGAFIPPIDASIVNGEIIARDGHCRTRAALRVCEEMPEYTLECRQLRGNEVDAVIHMLGTGSGGKPLSPLEQGKGFLRLVKMGLKHGEIAAKLGVSRSTIDNGVALAEAPLDVHKMVAAGEVSSTLARIAVSNGEEGIQALKEAVEGVRADDKGKKKVTAKKLVGTAAAKKPKAAPAYEPVNPSPAPPLPGDEMVRIAMSRDTAARVLELLRSYAPEDDGQKNLIAELERVTA